MDMDGYRWIALALSTLGTVFAGTIAVLWVLWLSFFWGNFLKLSLFPDGWIIAE